MFRKSGMINILGEDKMKGIILFVDYAIDYSNSWRRSLEKEGYGVIFHTSDREAIEDIRQGIRYDMALFHLSTMSDFDKKESELVKISKELNPNTKIVSYSGIFFKPLGVNHHFRRGVMSNKDFIDTVNEYFQKNIEHKLGVRQ